jgi:hypothetical protein
VGPNGEGAVGEGNAVSKLMLGYAVQREKGATYLAEAFGLEVVEAASGLVGGE